MSIPTLDTPDGVALAATLALIELLEQSAQTLHPSGRHVWLHVAGIDWRGRQAHICRCACGIKLTPNDIRAIRAAKGVPA